MKRHPPKDPDINISVSDIIPHPSHDSTLLRPRKRKGQLQLLRQRVLTSQLHTLQTLRAKLERADAVGVNTLIAIMEDPLTPPLIRLKAVSLAWQYRHGKPRETVMSPEEFEAKHGPTSGDGGIDGAKAANNTLIIVDGSSQDYVQRLKQLREGAKKPPTPTEH